jgi:hypothetical protein
LSSEAPALGTANIPQTAVVITNEAYSVVKNKYLLPQYLNKSIVIYDNDLFLHSGRIAVTEHVVQESSEFYTVTLNQPGFNVSNEHLYVEVFDGTNITIWYNTSSTSIKELYSMIDKQTKRIKTFTISSYSKKLSKSEKDLYNKVIVNLHLDQALVITGKIAALIRNEELKTFSDHEAEFDLRTRLSRDFAINM